jgi:tetratricopeptide (TPR) repeat protein
MIKDKDFMEQKPEDVNTTVTYTNDTKQRDEKATLELPKETITNEASSFPINPSSCLSIILRDSKSLGPAGPGGSRFQDAIQSLNNRNDQQAIDYFKEALNLGLDSLRQGYAHADLGEIYLRNNEIEKAMNQFIKVLNYKEALYDSVHLASQYLSIIYRGLGKPEIVNVLEQLKYKTTSKLNYSLSPEAVNRVSRLTMENKNRLIGKA